MKNEKYETIAKIFFIVLFGVYPIFVNPFNSPVFTHPKVALLWTTGFGLFLLVLWGYSKGKVEFGRLGALTLPLYVYLGIIVVTLMISQNQITSFFGQYSRWDGFLSLFGEIAIFTAAVLLVKKNKIKTFINAVFFSTIAVSLLAIYERLAENPLFILTKTYDPAGFGRPNTYDMSRSIATFGSPLYLAAFLVIVLPVALTVALNGENKKNKLPAVTAFLLGFIALIFTYGRGAWLGLLIAVVFLSFKKVIKIKQLVVIMAIIAAISLAIQLMPSAGNPLSVTGRIVSIFKMEAGARPEMWKSTLSMINASPLFGYGLDTFKTTFQKFKPAGWMILFKQPLLDKAHNEVLQTTASSGLIGLTVFVWLLTTIFYLILKYNRLKTGRRSYVSLGLAAGGLAYIAQSFFNFFVVSTAPIFWGALALAAVESGGFEDKIAAAQQNIGGFIRKIPVIFSAAAFIIAGTLGVLSWQADFLFQKYLDFKFNNQSGKALESIDKATRIFPWEDRYAISLGKANAQMARENAGYSQYYLVNANKAFDLARRINPNDEGVYFAKGSIFLEFAGQNNTAYLQEAIENFKKGLIINPSNLDAQLSLGLAYVYTGRPKDAISVWQRAVNISPNQSEILFNMGIIYEEMGQKNSALRAYRAALKADGNMTEAKERIKKINETSN